jgi:predicted dehydrogenase
MFKLGIIGCGKIVEVWHMPALKRLAEEGLVEVVALADPTEERRAAIGEALSIPEKSRYGSHSNMLEAEALDFVDIALPHFLHEKVTVDCARARVNIISEKPLATNLAEADSIIKACDKAGVILAVLHNYRYNPAMHKALELGYAGEIGEVFLIRYEGLSKSHWPGTGSYDPHWRTKKARAGGGCLIDNAYHNIYIAREFMASAIVNVYAQIETYMRPIDVDDTALVLFRHENKGTSSIQVSWGVNAGGRGVREIHGQEGSMVFGHEGKPLGLYKNSTGEWSYPETPTEYENSFAGIMADIFRAVESKSPVPTDGLEARRNLEAVMAAYESAEKEEVVKVNIPAPMSR